MQKRPFGKLETEVSLLGFGCMRFPTLANGQIDEDEAIAMLHYAIEQGVNYLDTAYGYHGGESEVLVGKALLNGYREKVKVATKLPVWLLESPADCGRIFTEQLERLGVEKVDYYLLHALNAESWQRSLKYEALEFLEEAQEAGRIGHLGFSFHDELPVFREIVDSYPWDFCQIQFNYMDESYQAGLAGLKYAASKGLGVIIMEPLRGGRLVRNLPPEIEALFASYPEERSPAEWAFRWVANHPEVSLILSGMNSLAEVKENLRILNSAQAKSMHKDELHLIKQAKDIYNERIEVLCTDCKYCLPCPEGVEIPRVFSLFNNASLYTTFESDTEIYKNMVKKGNDASRCISCGQCEEVCPQQLEIIEDLQRAHRAFLG